MRGNVNTRLAKLDAGEFDVLVLAVAGLERLGFSDRIATRLSVEESLPAAGQGALGIECLADATEVLERIAVLDEPAVAARVRAERAVAETLGASCSTPLGAFAERSDDGQLWLRARLASPDGAQLLTGEGRGADPEALGRQVAEQLFTAGAQPLLAALEQSG